MAADDSPLRIVLILVAVILLLPFVMMLLAMPMMGLFGWGYMGGGTGMTWIGIVGILMPVLVVLLLGYLLYRLLQGTDGFQRDSAMEELRIAYARGDLSDEEFEERRRRLQEE